MLFAEVLKGNRDIQILYIDNIEHYSKTNYTIKYFYLTKIVSNDKFAKFLQWLSFCNLGFNAKLDVCTFDQRMHPMKNGLAKQPKGKC